ncbi:14-3-3 domain-containing protein [Gymnopilus junonius]|uniref:14-3-3 domain-containing protein n=1 Tax=Gymnopilus junonius TaxID=109634 RepID=A0A9P5NXE1_GYMJU|nr:14-3-3 domain-containing protein [Gymnopilus junonius]
MSSFKTLSDFGSLSQFQIHVAGDLYNGPITNSAVGGRGNSVNIDNTASERIIKGNTQSLLIRSGQETQAANEPNASQKLMSHFRRWLDEDEATLSLTKEVPGTLSLSEMPPAQGAIKRLKDHLIPSAASAESKVFNLKMLGDCYRYKIQWIELTDAEVEEIADKSWRAYDEASQIAVRELSPINPIRLGLAIGFSLLYKDIFNSPERALNIIHHAWTDGSAEIGTITQEMYKDFNRNAATCLQQSDALGPVTYLSHPKIIMPRMITRVMTLEREVK